ncbi:hypothetical protein GCM10009785_12400 [Brooklawnia cerclae]|uniref:Cell division septum initiation protein DivIVA n=1 Tax=Brooklawnia cerclae TaxID=349934 RepID=A0ABX0SKI7_9ACTN|nr:hypothetical protein [Brooklawnia cerclae]NIH58531.1 cell division septum initiation protein DivIVA [Brooklawnia cerclae]
MTEPGFRFVRKGYEPSEVDQAVASLRSNLERLQTELNRAHDENAAKNVEGTKQRQQISDLSGRVRMLESTLADERAEKEAGVPPSFANLGERIGKMLNLAQDEANDVRAEAQEEANQLIDQADKQAATKRTEAEREAADTMSRARTEAARTIEDAKQRADNLLEEAEAEATARREEAEAFYENQRAQSAAAAADFEQTLAERREEALSKLNAELDSKTHEVALADERLSSARTEADRTTKEARQSADQIVREAQNKASQLLADAKSRAETIRQNAEREVAAATARRDSITAQLANVRQMLGTLGGVSIAGFDDAQSPRTAQQWASESTRSSSSGRSGRTSSSSDSSDTRSDWLDNN